MEVLDKVESKIAVYDPFYAQLAEVEKNNTAIVFDYESKKGNKDSPPNVTCTRGGCVYCSKTMKNKCGKLIKDKS